MRLGRSVWRDGFLCDAILTDPPYGIREGAKKLKRKEKEAYSKDFYRFHQYSLSDLYLDLLPILSSTPGNRWSRCVLFPVYDRG